MGSAAGRCGRATSVIWDQCHILQSGTFRGTYTVGGVAREVDGWVGQRDHSWGIRDHGRCPLWLWFQLQFEDGFLGVWHWELANGARVYTDGCWAGADGSDPVPLVDFSHDMEWVGPGGEAAAFGEHGEAVAGLRGSCSFVLEGGRRITVEATGHLRPPLRAVRTAAASARCACHADDGREGTAIYEITGARHHRYFPDTVVDGTLPS